MTFQRERDYRQRVAIEHHALYPAPSVKRGMLSSLNCISCVKSSEEGSGAPPDPEPEEEDSQPAIVEAEERYPTQEY